MALVDLSAPPAPPWNGGRRRSAQLVELLLDSGCRLTPADPPPRRSRAAVAAAGVRQWAAHGIYRPAGVASLRAAGGTRLRWRSLLAARPDCEAALIEACGFGALAALPLLATRGVRTVAVPVNVEALAPYDGPWTHRLALPARFREELRWWPSADRVFTISAEEAWLLALHGAPADRLPYYPTAACRDELARLKARRRPDRATGYLYFGDFRNAPNLLGLAALFEDLTAGRVVLDAPLNVAGRASDLARARLGGAPPGVTFLGEVSDDRLEDLLASCLAVVLRHPATSGSLTRAVELNLAGVPALANPLALKGVEANFVNASPGPDRPGPPAVGPPIAAPIAAGRRLLAALWGEDGGADGGAGRG